MVKRNGFNSFYPANTKINEFTVTSILVGVIFALIFGVLNTYLGLYAGMTFAAFYPTMIIALLIVNVIKGNLLEAHLAGVIASGAEAVVVAMVFTVPALVVLGVWTEIDVFVTGFIGFASGLLGVFFATFLRRTIIDDTDLKFPESVAISNILTSFYDTGDKKQGIISSSLWLIIGMIVSGVVIFGQQVLNIIETRFIFVKNIVVGKQETFVSGGFNVSPALLGLGWIIGPEITFLVFIGSLLSWLVLTPVIGLSTGFSLFMGPSNAVYEVWGDYTRYVSIGVLIIGFFYIIFQSRLNPFNLLKKFKSLFQKDKNHFFNRCDKDLNFKPTMILTVLFSILLFFTLFYVSNVWDVSLIVILLVLILGIIFVAVAGFFTGIMGSSNTPMFGIAIVMIILFSLMLTVFGINGYGSFAFLAIAGIIITCIVAVSSYLFQSMATGRIIGAKPQSLQAGTILGIGLIAFPTAFIIYLMDQAYLLGSPNVPVPQAFLMAGVIRGVLTGDMIWPYVIVGLVIGLILIPFDHFFKKPVIFAFAIGMYLPFVIATTLFIGGIIRYVTNKMINKSGQGKPDKVSDWSLSIKQKQLSSVEKPIKKGLLLSSGFILGEAFVVTLMAVFIYFGVDLAVTSEPLAILGVLSLVFLIMILAYIPLREIMKSN